MGNIFIVSHGCSIVYPRMIRLGPDNFVEGWNLDLYTQVFIKLYRPSGAPLTAPGRSEDPYCIRWKRAPGNWLPMISTAAQRNERRNVIGKRDEGLDAKRIFSVG